jgi:hypothetical protein
MDLESARRLRDNQDYVAFTKVLEEDVNALKEDILRDGVDLLSAKTKILTIRLVMNRLTSLIEDMEDSEKESVRSQGGDIALHGSGTP